MNARLNQQKISVLKKPFAIFLIAFSVLSFSISFADKPGKSILILMSYSPDYKWTARIEQGIRDALKDFQDISFHVEYMDTKRINNEEHFRNLYTLYKNKFTGQEFDIIISADDDAYRFLLKNRDTLFPGVPLVFCGVSGFKESDLAGQKGITGVVEDYDIKGTLDVAFKLHPGTKKVFVITDRTKSGKINLARMKRIIPDYKNRAKFIFLDDLKAEELKEKVRKMPQDSFILFLNFNRDRTGRVFTYEEAGKLVKENNHVPIYTCWDTRLEEGALGGIITTGYYQGKAAGEMARRILQGEKAGNIPVLKKSPNRYMFDYQEMKRFNIKPENLPEGSIIINEPPSFYSVNKKIIAITIFFVACLAFVIFILAMNILGRKEAENALKESEEKYRLLVENQKDLVVKASMDGKLDFVSPSYCELFGKTEEELRGRSFTPLVHEEDKKRVIESLRRLYEPPYTCYHEERALTKDGWRWLAWSNKAILDKDNNVIGFIGSGRDITEQKIAEEQLRSLYELGKKVTSISIASREELLPWIAEQAVGLLHVDVCNYRIREGDYLVRVGGFGGCEELRTERKIRIGESLAGIVARDKKPLVVPNVQEDERFIKEHREAAKKIGLTSFLSVPMMVGDEVKGVLSVFTKDPRKFTDSDISHLSAFSDIAAVALKSRELIENLEQEIVFRKNAEEDIIKSLREKELLLQEIHHRVKNNMQVISSILSLQSAFADDGKMTSILEECQDRIKSMALIHERLYEADDFANVRFKDYLELLIQHLINSYKGNSQDITLKSEVEDILLDLDTAIPLGLIINELITNALKHAFHKRREGELCIILHHVDGGKFRLIIADNGAGFPKDIDVKNAKSLGLRIVSLLVEQQLHGDMKIMRNRGTEFEIVFKKVQQKKRP